nr:Toll/interleukin-1 receptor (TIR) domain-containing protein [Tanacetum cinerariifolium]
MASSSSSSSQKSFKYDVFLSFRGEDTRKNFVDHLYYALKRKGIVTYKDDGNIEKGKRINEQLIKSIEDSRCYIIVFSKNYASSSWCLDELVKIMECQKMTEHTAYPLFYDVDVRMERISAKTGNDVDLIPSIFLSNNGHETKFIENFVQKISLDLHSINFILDEELIGMETRIRDVVSSLEINVDDVRMLGIWGMGGAGKTTLARAVFDQISFQFEGKSFVENVREESKPSLSGLKSLQKQVLSDILNDQGVTVRGVLDGKNKMKKAMGGKKVLVVLDDVDHKDQIEALAGDCNWFNPGSRIIITTRDKHVLAAHGVDLIHNVTLLSQAEADCLFSRRAFGRENPIQGYEKLSGKVLQYAAGLPLTIKVMGSHLRGLDKSEWKNAIKRLETIPFKDTMKVLELSYDGLEEDCKQIFLDVACILKGQDKEYAIRVLESRGFYGIYGLRVLERKSLITISEHDILKGTFCLGMHDHLEEMGRNIVRRSHPDEPQRHSRLWVKEEIEYMLTNKLGSPATQCLKLWSSGLSAEIAIKGLAKMKDLKVLYISVSHDCDDNSIIWEFDKVREYFPSSVRFIRWWNFPFSSLPSTFQGKYLVGLEITGRNIVQLWEYGEEKVLNNLRFLDIYNSKLRTFDLMLASNLEQLTISFCEDFVKLHIPTDYCLKLEHLDLSHSKLTNLHLGNAPNLKTLKLSGHDLVGFQMPAEILKLEHLDLSASKLTNLHLENTLNLKKLKLEGCHDLVKFQMPAESLKLEYLDLSHSKLTNLHLENTPNLKKLILDECNDLIEFQMPVESLKLEYLVLSSSKLTNLHLGNTPNLKKLILNWCNNLVLLPELGRVKSLKELDIRRTGIRRLPHSIFRLKGLRIIGSTELFESYGLTYKIQTSLKGTIFEETFCYI